MPDQLHGRPASSAVGRRRRRAAQVYRALVPGRAWLQELWPAGVLAGYGAFEVLSGVAPGVGVVPGDPATSAVAAVLAGAAVGLRRRAPVLGLGSSTLAILAESLLTRPAEGLAPLLAGLWLIYAVSVRCSQRTAVLALLAVVVALGTALGDPVFLGVLYCVPWLAGRVLGRRQDQLLSLQLRAAAEAEAAVRAERERIAAELHDVVSHALSLVVVQAQVAQATVRTDPDAAEGAVTAIRLAGQQALADMRRMVGVLEVEVQQSSELTPLPGLDQLPQLVEDVRAAGLDVTLGVTGAPRPLAPGASLAAYRVVQEGLTNVLRHAGVRQARVDLRWGAAGLTVTVQDDGYDGSAQPGGGGGHGLRGLQERIALYGGTLSSGARTTGGFQLEAVLPA